MHVMDEAGEGAKACKETAGGAPVPAGPADALRQPHALLTQHHSLLTKSVWCGLVFALALVLTAINLLPPAPVGYRVSTRMFASPQRLEVLKRKLMAHASAAPGGPQLLGIDMLDAEPQAVDRAKPLSDPLTLIEVRSLWPTRTDSHQVHQWLNALTEPDQRSLSKVDAANAERFARWEFETAQHYLKHFRHTRRRFVEQEEGQQATLTSAADGPPTRFASLSSTPSDISQPQTSAAADAVEARLVQEVQQAAAREKTIASAAQEQALKLSGILTLAGSPRVRAQPNRVPTAMVLSIIVLGLAGGAIGGWAHHRAQSGGIFYAAEVARSMDDLGLPTLGVLHIAGAGLQATAGHVQRRVTHFRRWAIQKSLTLTEWIVMFWCMAIAIRLVLDPVWRTMLLDNPLAALGRLFVGLP
jgi:hypothetical protein